MGILSWIVLGLIAGAIAKLLMPGEDPGGCILTVVLGIVGALLGGFIGTALGFGTVTGFDVRSLVIAIGGALILLIGYRLVASRRMT
ncbi:MAG: GlsB/YeaQ/YmgE family stress response membrane protein [Candidatus Paceibacterota bacterium]